MTNTVQSTNGYISKDPTITLSGDTTYLGAFRFTGAAPNGIYPVPIQLFKTSATQTYFEMFQFPPDDPTSPNRVEIYYRDSGSVAHETIFTGNGDYYNQWIHWAYTINGTTGAAHIYLLKEGFNPLSPSYLTTVSLGNVLNNPSTVSIWREVLDPATLATNCQQAGIIIAPFEASEAQVLAQFAQRNPTAAFSGAGTYIYLAMTDQSTVNVDTGSAASNFNINVNSFTNVTSEPSEWTPLGPTINTQPQSQSIYSGNTAIFTVSATGTGTLHYQWKQNGSNVGTDSSSYTTPATTLANNGDIYTVVVTDNNGNTTSNNAILTVLTAFQTAWFVC